MSCITFISQNGTWPLEDYHAAVKDLFHPLPKEGVLADLALRVMVLILIPVAYPVLGLLWWIGYICQDINTKSIETRVNQLDRDLHTLNQTLIDELKKCDVVQKTHLFCSFALILNDRSAVKHGKKFDAVDPALWEREDILNIARNKTILEAFKQKLVLEKKDYVELRMRVRYFSETDHQEVHLGINFKPGTPPVITRDKHPFSSNPNKNSTQQFYDSIDE